MSKIYLFVIIAIFILLGCKKPGDTPVLIDYLLENKWTIDSLYSYDNSQLSGMGKKENISGSIDFKNDGNIYFQILNNSGSNPSYHNYKSSYKLLDDNISIITSPYDNTGVTTAEVDTIHIEVITEKQFISTQRNTKSNTAERIYLHK